MQPILLCRRKILSEIEHFVTNFRGKHFVERTLSSNNLSVDERFSSAIFVFEGGYYIAGLMPITHSDFYDSSDTKKRYDKLKVTNNLSQLLITTRYIFFMSNMSLLARRLHVYSRLKAHFSCKSINENTRYKK